MLRNGVPRIALIAAGGDIVAGAHRDPFGPPLRYQKLATRCKAARCAAFAASRAALSRFFALYEPCPSMIEGVADLLILG